MDGGQSITPHLKMKNGDTFSVSASDSLSVNKMSVEIPVCYCQSVELYVC
jgi:hypothetical protein